MRFGIRRPFGKGSSLGLPALLLVWCALGCAPGYTVQGAGAQAEFERAKHLFDEHRWFQAVEALDAFRGNHPGSDRVDDATYLLGRAHDELGEHTLAQAEYDRVLSDYPQSEYREETEWSRGLSFYEASHIASRDPEPVLAALDAFEAYLRHYPEGGHGEDAKRQVRLCLDRLATKAYLNGETYLRLRKPAAARVYFEKCLAFLPDASRAPDARYGLAVVEQELGNSEKARRLYREFLDGLSNEQLARHRRLRGLKAAAEAALASPLEAASGKP